MMTTLFDHTRLIEVVCDGRLSQLALAKGAALCAC